MTQHTPESTTPIGLYESFDIQFFDSANRVALILMFWKNDAMRLARSKTFWARDQRVSHEKAIGIAAKCIRLGMRCEVCE